MDRSTRRLDEGKEQPASAPAANILFDPFSPLYPGIDPRPTRDLFGSLRTHGIPVGTPRTEPILASFSA